MHILKVYGVSLHRLSRNPSLSPAGSTIPTMSSLAPSSSSSSPTSLLTSSPASILALTRSSTLAANLLRLAPSGTGSSPTSLSTSSPASIVALTQSSTLAASALQSSQASPSSISADLTHEERFRLALELAFASGPQTARSGLSSVANAMSAEGTEIIEGTGNATPAFLTFPEFVDIIRAAPLALRSLPITCIDRFEKKGMNILGAFGHHYVVVTVLLPDARPTYVRFDLFSLAGGGGSWEGPCSLRVRMSDKFDTLSKPGPSLLAQISRTPIPGKASGEGWHGPSLDALATLLHVIDGRVGRGYGPFGRNCWWMADLLVFGMARKFSGHWLEGPGEGKLVPEGTLRRYMRGEIGMLHAGVECSGVPPDPIARGIVHGFGFIIRGIQTLATRNDRDRFVMHDDEIAEVLGAFKDFLPAVLP